MRIVNLALLTTALLLAACAPVSVAQPEMAEPATPAAAIQNTPAPANTAMPSVENGREIPDSNDVPSKATMTHTIAATGSASLSAAQPAALPESAPMSAAISTQAAPAYENLMSPVDLLSSYYNAINRQEYARAYSYWQQPPNDYDSFAAGYADTASVQLIVQPPTRIEGAAGSLYVEIPTVLIAHHHDGSVHTFAGCIVTRKSNLQSPDIPEEDVWHLYQAQIAEVENNAVIPTLLAQGCAS